jgi:hypothetical protein
MQREIAIRINLSNKTGRNILAGILKRIKDSDDCTIRIASDADDFRRLSASATALIADSSPDFLRMSFGCPPHVNSGPSPR